jgi:hypothetical protein
MDLDSGDMFGDIRCNWMGIGISKAVASPLTLSSTVVLLPPLQHSSGQPLRRGKPNLLEGPGSGAAQAVSSANILDASQTVAGELWRRAIDQLRSSGHSSRARNTEPAEMAILGHQSLANPTSGFWTSLISKIGFWGIPY